MTALLVTLTVIEVWILYRFFKVEKNRQIFLKTQPKLISTYQAKKSKLITYMVLALLVVFYAYLIEVEAYIAFLPLLTVGIFQEMKQISDIKLYDEGIIFNRRFIQWQEIETVNYASEESLLVVGKTLPYGQMRSTRLRNRETLLAEIESYIANRKSEALK